MKLLLDTHILLWAAASSPKLSSNAASLIKTSDNSVFFSVVSLWEIAIKVSLDRADFSVDVLSLRDLALRNGYEELPIAIGHVVALANLALLHKDPFDRMLIAQARTEGIVLLTNDSVVASYGSGILRA